MDEIIDFGCCLCGSMIDRATITLTADSQDAACYLCKDCYTKAKNTHYFCVCLCCRAIILIEKEDFHNNNPEQKIPYKEGFVIITTLECPLCPKEILTPRTLEDFIHYCPN